MEGLTVVVSPLVALKEDQLAALRLAGVQAETINSSRTYENNADSWRRVAAGFAQFSIFHRRLMTERMLIALEITVRLTLLTRRMHFSLGACVPPRIPRPSKSKDRFPCSCGGIDGHNPASTRADRPTSIRR